MKLKFSGMKKNGWASASIPYKLSDDVKKENLPSISMMTKVKGPESKSSEAGLFLMVDMPADEEIPSNPIELLFGDYYYTGAYVDGEENYWSHLYMTAAEGEVMMGKDFSRDRKIVLYFYAATDGDFEVNVDDAGLSKECDGSDFGKYDFYNGTSMAAPAVTGTVALLASELRDCLLYTSDAADEL